MSTSHSTNASQEGRQRRLLNFRSLSLALFALLASSPQTVVAVNTVQLTKQLPADFSSCLNYARAQPFTEEIARPRPLPNPRQPLVAHGWSRPASHAFFTDGYKRFNESILRYKVLNGKVYSDREALSTVFHHGYYRKVFEEMLVLAVWLFDLPDMDLVINTADRPLAIPEFPVLSWAYEAQVGEGYAIPHHVHWDTYGFGSHQLEQYAYCLAQQYPPEQRTPKAFWRGAPSGASRGWEEPPRDTKLQDANEAMRLVFNKRALVSLVSQNYPFMDVGVTPDEKGGDSSAAVPMSSLTVVEAQVFDKLLTKAAVPTELWNKYAVQLSMEGQGFTDRIPAQLLSNTPVLMMDSDRKEWFDDFFVDGVHVVKFSSDASDVVTKAKAMIDESLFEPEHLIGMAAEMQRVALQRFNVLAVMDAFAWALVDSHRWCKWPVQMAPEFQPVYLQRPAFNPNIPEDTWSQVLAESHGAKRRRRRLVRSLRSSQQSRRSAAASSLRGTR